MSDPAVEAAQRAWVGNVSAPAFDAPSDQNYWMVIAAREALKPIRELHKPITMCGVSCCQRCRAMNGAAVGWPCETAKLAYTADELRPGREPPPDHQIEGKHSVRQRNRDRYGDGSG